MSGQYCNQFDHLVCVEPDVGDLEQVGGACDIDIEDQNTDISRSFQDIEDANSPGIEEQNTNSARFRYRMKCQNTNNLTSCYDIEDENTNSSRSHHRLKDHNTNKDEPPKLKPNKGEKLKLTLEEKEKIKKEKEWKGYTEVKESEKMIEDIKKRMVLLLTKSEATTRNLFSTTDIPCLSLILLIWKLIVLLVCGLIIYVGWELGFNFKNILLSGACVKMYTKGFYDDYIRLNATEDFGYLDFENPSGLLGLQMIIVNSFYVVGCIIFGIIPLHRSKWIFFVLTLAQAAAILIETFLSNIFLNVESAANLEYQDRLTEWLKDYVPGSSDPKALSYDLVSLWGSCCGIKNKYDWPATSDTAENDFQLLPTSQIKYGIEALAPASCCQMKQINTTFHLTECMQLQDPLYSRGCYSVVLEFLQQYTKYYTGLVVSIHIIDCYVTIFVWFNFLGKLRLDFTQLAKLEILYGELNYQHYLIEKEKKRQKAAEDRVLAREAMKQEEEKQKLEKKKIKKKKKQ